MERYDLSYMSAVLLCQMGISTLEECDAFLFAKDKNLPSPYLFSQMEQVAERIRRGVLEEEKIVIYSDYDCDGIMGAVLLYKALVHIGAKVSIRIPSRFAGGYGLSPEAVEDLRADGASLVITVDNGIVAHGEALLLHEAGIDLIITDHHTPAESLPLCEGVLCPKVKGERYPFKELCGAGVAFKLCLVLLKMFSLSPFSRVLLPYAAIATIADMVPLTGENRTIVSLGLSELNRSEDVGLRAILACAGYQNKAVESGIVAFQIAPRINAVGRMGEVDELLELLLTEDAPRAKELASKLETVNTQRKDATAAVMASCEEYLQQHDLLSHQKVLFFALPDAPKGVVGLAAGKLSEKYSRPCVVFSVDGQEATGSARSVKNFDIYAALSVAKERYVKFGGHTAAAGLTVNTCDLDDIARLVNEHSESLGIDDALVKTLFYDAVCTSAHLTQKFVSELGLFAPFGIGNPKPVFLAKQVLVDNVSFMGADKSHARMNLSFGEGTLQGVWFSGAQRLKELDLVHKRYDVLFSASINSYGSRSSVQLEVVDMQPSVEGEEAFYQSLYQAFLQDDTTPKLCAEGCPALGLSLEGAIEQAREGDLFVSFSPETLARVSRYCAGTGRKLAVRFSSWGAPCKEDEPCCINLLMCPLEGSGGEGFSRVILLDETIFASYPHFEAPVFKLKDELDLFYIPTKIDREFVLDVYKSLRLLGALGGEFALLLERLRHTAKVELNSFCLKLCLDVMQELEILKYRVYNTKLDVRFCPVDQKKNIEDSPTVKRLNGCYEKLKKE